MRTEQQLKDLIQRFSEGRATADEIRLLYQWLDKASAARPEAQLPAEQRDRLLLDFRKNVRFRSGLTVQRRLLVQKVAAAAAIIVLLAGSWMLWKERRENDETVVKITTSTGEIRRIVLPDSSVVWMNANTVLTYPAAFTHQRSIKLNGEALFNVRTDEAHPFLVQTQDGLETKVLGTQFNIRSYGQLHESRITVLSGKVSVSRSEQHLSLGILTANESIQYSRETNGSSLTKEEDAAALAAWHKGEWNMKGQGVEELTVLLYNNYSIRLINKKENLQSLQLDANFNNRQTADDILSTFCLLAHCQYRWVNAKIVELY